MATPSTVLPKLKEGEIHLGRATPPVEPQTQFILYYRKGDSPYPQFLFFFWPGNGKNLQPIVERCKRYCDAMNLKFTQVRPAFVDFDEQERKREGE